MGLSQWVSNHHHHCPLFFAHTMMEHAAYLKANICLVFQSEDESGCTTTTKCVPYFMLGLGAIKGSIMGGFFPADLGLLVLQVSISVGKKKKEQSNNLEFTNIHHNELNRIELLHPQNPHSCHANRCLYDEG